MDRIAAIKAGARFPSAETSTKVSDRGNYTGATLSLSGARIIPGLREKGKDPRVEFMLIFLCLSSRARPFLGKKILVVE